MNYTKGELHIVVEQGATGNNPPYIRDDEGYGHLLWSHWGKILGIGDKGEDGFLLYLSKDELAKHSVASDMYDALWRGRRVIATLGIMAGVTESQSREFAELIKRFDETLAKAEGK